MNSTLPTLSFAPGSGWEIILPAEALPADIANITITDEGIYLETTSGDYDLITYTDLLDVMVPARLGRVIASNNGHSWPAATAIYLEDSPASSRTSRPARWDCAAVGRQWETARPAVQQRSPSGR